MTDNLLFIDIKEIVNKFKVFFIPLHYSENPDYIVFEHFYSEKYDEYFEIKPLLVLSSHSTNKHSHINDSTINETDKMIRNIKMDKTVSKLSNKFDFYQMMESLLVENTKNMEELSIEGNVEEGKKHYSQIIDGDTYYRKEDYVYIQNIKYPEDLKGVKDTNDIQIIEEELEIVKIIDLWKTQKDEIYFKGIKYLKPKDIEHIPIKMFYKNEVFKTGIEVEGTVDLIHSKCFVNHEKYYKTKKPVNYNENDVYICESMYNETTNNIRKSKPFNVPSMDTQVIQNEYVNITQDDNIIKVESPFLIEQVKLINEARINIKSNLNETNVKLLNSPSTLKFQSSRKRRKSTNITLSPIYNKNLETYICLWKDCDLSFETIEDLAKHVYEPKEHLKMAKNGTFSCYWNDCLKPNQLESKHNYQNQTKLFTHVCNKHFPTLSKEFINGILKFKYESIQMSDDLNTHYNEELNYKETKIDFYKKSEEYLSGFNKVMFPLLTKLTKSVENLENKICKIENDVIRLEEKYQDFEKFRNEFPNYRQNNISQHFKSGLFDSFDYTNTLNDSKNFSYSYSLPLIQRFFVIFCIYIYISAAVDILKLSENVDLNLDSSKNNDN